jgi:16S rRNA (adenine1518-N6/adenine1519-N6)-dimethyltransferase
MRARKRFGQHFLHDPGIIRRIVESVAPVPTDRVVEIGPGRGALTFELLARAGAMEAIEIDRDLAATLAADPRAGSGLRVHVQDVLHTDFAALRGSGPKLRIVGNLPYNISTPLLFRLIEQRSAILDMHFMLQKEVVDRMAAPPGGKDYGRLTVMIGAYAEVEALLEVGAGAFQPPPRVRSAVVRLRPAERARFEIGDHGVLRMVTTAAFSQRRKTLRNGLKSLLSSEEIEACGIDPGLRPESLAPAQFGALAARYSALRRGQVSQSP